MPVTCSSVPVLDFLRQQKAYIAVRDQATAWRELRGRQPATIWREFLCAMEGQCPQGGKAAVQLCGESGSYLASCRRMREALHLAGTTCVRICLTRDNTNQRAHEEQRICDARRREIVTLSPRVERYLKLTTYRVEALHNKD